MSATAVVHARIEHLAAGLLDALPAFMATPGAAEKAQQWAELEAKCMPTLDAICVAAAIDKGSATLCAYERGGESALTHATIVDMLFAWERPPLRWCAHRYGIATSQPTMVSGALRYAACLECFEAEHKAQADRLATETTCDVCGADDGMVTQRAMQLGSLVVSLFTGACCDELFTYRQAVASRIYRRLGRNEPCPCGAGRKYKHCHGSPKAGAHE